MIILNKLKKYRLTSAIFLLSFLLVFGGTLWAIVGLGSSSQILILHFSEYSGITKTGGVSDLIMFGVFGLLILGINMGLAVMLQERERFLGKIVTGGSLFLAILIFISLSAIISVN